MSTRHATLGLPSWDRSAWDFGCDGNRHDLRGPATTQRSVENARLQRIAARSETYKQPSKQHRVTTRWQLVLVVPQCAKAWTSNHKCNAPANHDCLAHSSFFLFPVPIAGCEHDSQPARGTTRHASCACGPQLWPSAGHRRKWARPNWWPLAPACSTQAARHSTRQMVA